MTPAPHVTDPRARTVPRVALRAPGEAAESLGVSVDFFEEHIQPELRLIRRGRLKFVTLAELERWCERNSALTVSDV